MRVSRGITQLLMAAASSRLQLRRYIFKSCKALAWTISTAFLVTSEKCEKKRKRKWPSVANRPRITNWWSMTPRYDWLSCVSGFSRVGKQLLWKVGCNNVCLVLMGISIFHSNLCNKSNEWAMETTSDTTLMKAR